MVASNAETNFWQNLNKCVCSSFMKISQYCHENSVIKNQQITVQTFSQIKILNISLLLKFYGPDKYLALNLIYGK